MGCLTFLPGTRFGQLSLARFVSRHRHSWPDFEALVLWKAAHSNLSNQCFGRAPRSSTVRARSVSCSSLATRIGRLSVASPLVSGCCTIAWGGRPVSPSQLKVYSFPDFFIEWIG